MFYHYEGNFDVCLKDVQKYSISEAMSFKFGPTTSVDVDQSFSMYKNVLCLNWQSFLFENLNDDVYCNQNLN